MKKRIPISAAKRIADEYGQSHVVIVTFDKDAGGTAHVVTYGRTVEECAQAALGGNFVKKALGWPESACHAVPARALKVFDSEAAALVLIEKLEACSEGHGPKDVALVAKALSEAFVTGLGTGPKKS